MAAEWPLPLFHDQLTRKQGVSAEGHARRSRRSRNRTGATPGYAWPQGSAGGYSSVTA